MRYYNDKQSGFTLIEIAVVLVIVAVLLGSFIGTLSDRIDTSQRDSAKKELAEIKKVLQAYAYTQGAVAFLPCPDITVPPDGQEDRIGNACAAGVGVIGVLPWRDLGIGEADPWGNRYQYWVSNNYSNAAGFTLSSSDTGAGNGAIQTRRNDNNVTIVQNAVAVVFSRGKNSLGGISVEDVAQPAIPAPGGDYDDENENADANSVFMSRPPTDVGVATAGGVFDDMLIWINSYELKAKVIEAGITLPP